MSTDIWWKLHTKNEADILADYALTSWDQANQQTRGQTARVNLHFNVDEDLVVSGSYTVSANTVEQYDAIIVESGATLTIESGAELYGDSLDNDGTINNNGTLTIYGSVFDRIQQYGDWAGKYAQPTMSNGVEKYREQFPTDRADVDSLVLGIEPAQKLQDNHVNGIWGIVDRVTDQRPSPFSDTQFEIEVTVLAEFAEYADHAAIESDLQI